MEPSPPATHGFGDTSWAEFWAHLRGRLLYLQIEGTTYLSSCDLVTLLHQAAPVLHFTPAHVTQQFGTINPNRAIAIERAYILAFFDLQLRHHDTHPGVLILDYPPVRPRSVASSSRRAWATRPAASRPIGPAAPRALAQFWLIHPRPGPFTGGRAPPVPAGHERWRTEVNGGAQYSKACEGASLPWVQIRPSRPERTPADHSNRPSQRASSWVDGWSAVRWTSRSLGPLWDHSMVIAVK